MLSSKPQVTDPHSRRYATNPVARLKYQNEVVPAARPVAPMPMTKPPVASVMPTTALTTRLPGAMAFASSAVERGMGHDLLVWKIADDHLATIGGG